MSRPLSPSVLEEENRAFAGTNGVSSRNRAHRFVPAFRDTATGRVEIARFANGKPANAHVLTGLPSAWAARLGPEGEIAELLPTICAGFVRDDVFYTREEAAAACPTSDE
ncbi:MAG: hypothetical protein AAF515_16405 [Pseudomonadota bacterium]